MTAGISAVKELDEAGTAAPLLSLSAIALALCAAGWAALRRRDIG